MGVDWTSVVTAGSVSAVVGGVVSLLTARHVARQQEFSRTALEARREIQSLVGPVLTKVRQYQGRARGSMGRGDDDRHALHLDDVVLCGQVLAAAGGLSLLRRVLVKRRLRKLFGASTVEFCALNGRDAANPDSSVAMVLQRQAMGLLHPEHELSQPDRGEFDSALRHAPDSDDVAQLIRSLKRLLQCR